MWKAEKLGLVLRALTTEDMNDMRLLRNEESIRKMHLYQEVISFESQMAWWSNLNKSRNLYLGLFYEKKLIGVVNLKDIDQNNKIAESGAFMHTDYQGTGLVALGSYCLMKYAFEGVNLNRIIAKVLTSNEPALKYNLSLGFKIIESTDKYHSIEVTADDFHKSTQRMGRLFDKQIQICENERD